SRGRGAPPVRQPQRDRRGRASPWSPRMVPAGCPICMARGLTAVRDVRGDGDRARELFPANRLLRRIHPPRVPSSPMKKVGVVVSLVVAVLVGCAAQTPSAVAPPPAAMLVTPQSTGVPPPAAPVAAAAAAPPHACGGAPLTVHFYDVS